MKKIYVGKADPITLVIEKVIKASEEDIVLYVPRGSVSFSVRNNFKLLKREANAAGKTVSFESVDDDVLELAQAFDMKALNPFFGRKKLVADIIVKEPGTIKLKEDKEEESEPQNIKKTRKQSHILTFKQKSFGLWGTEP